ncbi:N-acetylmuramate alpha-1-phosphate uridylyltransferase MurU [Solimicrobium silvestre]|uniref:Nucleoside-diphosphate-sugar pyrophosphorylase n=1 Tax=Solimicrobium silvestre TaxID=2099400 RepID=A0A2S9H193_9BURK|nr:nucleotidyltransferase family protein [Solimicrobium silvestre]PRC93754.1 Nucleoside-diphosphate-sugar pyrophosphorylase [Solimicrobium silvestre]
MKAILLAAGRGVRMMPLTEHCPKPLLKVRGRPLIVWHILNLVKAGISEIVINHAYLGDMIEKTLGDGSQFGAQISYSPETTALETAGGIANALHLLGDQPFVAVAADIYCPHFDFSECLNTLEDNDMWGNPHPIDKRDIAWLYMVKNPRHHPNGDFAVNLLGLSNEGEPRATFSGIGVYRPEMFASIEPGTSAKLVSLFRDYADRGQLGGEVVHCAWTDVGTPERLAELNTPLTSSSMTLPS